MNRDNIDKIAKTPEDRMLLAKIWDKIQRGMVRQVPANTAYLSPREQEMARFLFGQVPGLVAFGGYPEAERRMLCFLPEYMDESDLMGEDSPVICLHAAFFQGDSLSHRDFLGALMASGISRESVGDICVGKGFCDFFVTEELAEYLLENFVSAGRTRIHLERIPLSEAVVPEPETKQIRDTLASLRLDGVISSGFQIGRSLAAQYVTAGKASVNGMPCEKPDKTVEEGMKISVRGLGKICLYHVGGITKKGRIAVEIHRYL